MLKQIQPFKCCKTLNEIQMGLKKCSAMRLEVIYDSQVTNRKQGRLLVRAPLSFSTPIGRLGVIYESQLAEIHKNTTTNR